MLFLYMLRLTTVDLPFTIQPKFSHLIPFWHYDHKQYSYFAVDSFEMLSINVGWIILWFCSQPSATTNNMHEGYWKQGVQGYQSYHASSLQFQTFRSLWILIMFLEAFILNNLKLLNNQMCNIQLLIRWPKHINRLYQQLLKLLPPMIQVVPCNVQIPTNPRISSNLPVGLSKNNNATAGVTKPAYNCDLLPKPNDNVSSSAAAADSSLKVRLDLYLKKLLLISLYVSTIKWINTSVTCLLVKG